MDLITFILTLALFAIIIAKLPVGVAVGFLILLVIQFYRQLQIAKADNTQRDQIVSLIKELSSSLEQFLQHEVQILEKETGRAKGFVNESVEQVSNSFKNIQSLVLEQQKLLLQLMQNVKTDDENDYLRQLNNFTKSIEKTVQQGVISLQFEDFTNQCLTSLTANIDNLISIQKQLVSLLSLDGEELITRLAEVKLHFDEVLLKSQKQNTERSVKQDSLEEGEVELF